MAHIIVQSLARQEAAWGATSKLKEGWQEQAARDVTEITNDRAITRPETLYANNVCADLTLEYLTSLARPEEWRFKVHPSAFHDVTSM